jgi:hypothetical protein
MLPASHQPDCPQPSTLAGSFQAMPLKTGGAQGWRGRQGLLTCLSREEMRRRTQIFSSS